MISQPDDILVKRNKMMWDNYRWFDTKFFSMNFTKRSRRHWWWALKSFACIVHFEWHYKRTFMEKTFNIQKRQPLLVGLVYLPCYSPLLQTLSLIPSIQKCVSIERNGRYRYNMNIRDKVENGINFFFDLIFRDIYLTCRVETLNKAENPYLNRKWREK